MVRWTTDDWKTHHDENAGKNTLDLHYVDIPVLEESGTLRFTLFWKGRNSWEGQDYSVTSKVHEIPKSISMSRGK